MHSRTCSHQGLHLSLPFTPPLKRPRDNFPGPDVGNFRGWVWNEVFPGHNRAESWPPSLSHCKLEVCTRRGGDRRS